MLTKAWQRLQVHPLDGPHECLLVLCVLLRVSGFAVGVPGGDEGAAVHAMRVVQQGQCGAVLADVQSKRGQGVYVIGRFQVGLDGARVDDAGVRKQKTLL